MNLLKTCQRHVLNKELTLHNSKNEQNLALESRFAFTMRTWLCKTRLDVNYSNFFLPFEVYDSFDNLKIFILSSHFHHCLIIFGRMIITIVKWNVLLHDEDPSNVFCYCEIGVAWLKQSCANTNYIFRKIFSYSSYFIFHSYRFWWIARNEMIQCVKILIKSCWINLGKSVIILFIISSGI